MLYKIILININFIINITLVLKMGFMDKFKKAFKSNNEEKIDLKDNLDDNTNANIKNFKYLDELIQSGVKEIVLDANIVLGSREEDKYLEGIRLEVDDLIIDGNGYEIDAKEKVRIFECTAKNVTIKNLTLKNGFADGEGGAIRSSGELNIVNSSFTANLARAGGAIGNTGGKLSVRDSSFTKNTAISSPGGGGAIYYHKGECCITGSTFKANLSRNGGGALCNILGKCSIMDSIFTANTAHGDGGAVDAHDELSISESVFSRNSAGADGGAICNIWGDCSIDDSTFTKNTADANGGAIVVSGILRVSNSTFTKNRAENGGVIFDEKEYSSITKSTLNDNTAVRGAAIYNVDGGFAVSHCEISANKSVNGIIYNKSFLESFNTKINNNQSENIIFNFSEKFNVSIIYGEFLKNTAEKAVIFNAGNYAPSKKAFLKIMLQKMI